MAKIEPLKNWNRTIYTPHGELLLYYNGYDHENEKYEVNHVMKFSIDGDVNVTPELKSWHKTEEEALQYLRDIELHTAEQITESLSETVKKAINAMNL